MGKEPLIWGELVGNSVPKMSAQNPEISKIETVLTLEAILSTKLLENKVLTAVFRLTLAIFPT